MPVWRLGVYWKALCLPLNFISSLKHLLKSSRFFFKKGTERPTMCHQAIGYMLGTLRRRQGHTA